MFNLVLRKDGVTVESADSFPPFSHHKLALEVCRLCLCDGEVIRDTDHRPTTNSQCAKTFRFDVCDGEVVV